CEDVLQLVNVLRSDNLPSKVVFSDIAEPVDERPVRCESARFNHMQHRPELGRVLVHHRRTGEEIEVVCTEVECSLRPLAVLVLQPVSFVEYDYVPAHLKQFRIASNSSTVSGLLLPQHLVVDDAVTLTVLL